MPHPRQVIRDAVHALLVAASTAAGSSVHKGRLFPLQRGEVPAILVFTRSEDVDTSSAETSPRELLREIDLQIEAWASAADGVEDELDDLALEIENAMHADPYLGGVASDCILSRTTISPREEGGRPYMVAALSYSATYRTLAPEETIVDDYLTTDAEYNLGNAVDPGDVASDQFEMQV